jgi:prevent-host-death family protein
MVRSETPHETTMKLTDTKQHLSEVVNRVARGEIRVVVEKSGLPVVAIISADEYRRFNAHEQERAAKRAILFETFARFSDAFDDVPDEELEREIANAQAEVRAEVRAEVLAERRAKGERMVGGTNVDRGLAGEDRTHE